MLWLRQLVYKKQNGDVLLPAGVMFSYGWSYETEVSCSQCK